jgi:hypothetical protein
MKGIQLPVVSNATTGHKLQGSSVDSIFVHAWIYENWTYVVLSRVRTHKGLYLRHPLDFDLRRYAVPPRLKCFLVWRTDTNLLTLKIRTMRLNLLIRQ